MNDWLEAITLGELLIPISIIGSVIGALRWVMPTLRRATHLLDDLVGEAERPGHPARPGALERLATVESQLLVIAAGQARTTTQVAELRTELRAYAQAHKDKETP